MPPAVKTELHTIQPDLVEMGLGDIGMELNEFADFTWGELQNEEREEVWVDQQRGWKEVDAKRREVFEGSVKAFRGMGLKF